MRGLNLLLPRTSVTTLQRIMSSLFVCGWSTLNSINGTPSVTGMNAMLSDSGLSLLLPSRLHHERHPCDVPKDPG